MRLARKRGDCKEEPGLAEAKVVTEESSRGMSEVREGDKKELLGLEARISA